MNSNIWKCSKCNNHTKINKNYGIININYKCGYPSIMRIKEYIRISKKINLILLLMMILS